MTAERPTLPDRDVEHRLALEGELLETFLALVPDAAIVVDGDGRIRSLNEQALELFGYEAHDLIGERVEMLVPERFRHRHRQYREEYAEHPRARAMGAGQDLTGRRADGSEVAVDISLAPIGLMDHPLVVAGIRDATERRAATAAQAQLAAIVESSRDGIVAMTLTGIVASWNAGAEGLLGYAAADIVGTHISRLIPASQTEVFEELLSATLEGRVPNPRDTEWQAADGKLLPIALSMSPLRDAGDERIGFSVSFRDITERKLAEREAARLLAEVRKQERWQAANAEIRLGVLSGASLEHTLEVVCTRACELIEVDAGVVVLLGPPPTLAAGSARTAHLAGWLDALPAPLVGLIEAGEPRVASEPLDLDEAMVDVVGERPLVAPIIAGGSPVGALLLQAPLEPATSPQPLVVAESLANQAALAVELGRARHDAERLLLSEDRERIARDLHDVVIQRLFASGMSLQAALSTIGDERAAERVSKVVDSLDATISEIRTAIFALGSVTGDGRVRADVIAEVRRAAEQLGFLPRVRFEGPVDSAIAVETAAHVLAVLTEALSNVVRHAHARTVEVSLAVGSEVVLVVADDGVGLGAPDRQSGLANMRRRAEDLGGNLELDSTPDGGTRVTWRVPVRR
jgi:PAS domain S-box-containing protein